jgi:hypothetical protein
MSFRTQRYILAIILALLPVVIIPTSFFEYFWGIIGGVLLIFFSVGLGNAMGWIAGGRRQKLLIKLRPRFLSKSSVGFCFSVLHIEKGTATIFNYAIVLNKNSLYHTFQN